MISFFYQKKVSKVGPWQSLSNYYTFIRIIVSELGTWQVIFTLPLNIFLWGCFMQNKKFYLGIRKSLILGACAGFSERNVESRALEGLTKCISTSLAFTRMLRKVHNCSSLSFLDLSNPLLDSKIIFVSLAPEKSKTFEKHTGAGSCPPCHGEKG